MLVSYRYSTSTSLSSFLKCINSVYHLLHIFSSSSSDSQHYSSIKLVNNNQIMAKNNTSVRVPTRVLFCGPHFPASHNYTRDYLKSYPYIQVDDVPLDNVPNIIADYDICVVKNRRFDAELISRANKMKLIMQFGVGLEGVDVDAATRHGIKVARIPGNVSGNSASCAEMAIYLMLGLLRKRVGFF
ncbi:hypothetical protein AQUCO_00600080v1 [Aquilegia coerulea]|uniref:D-isomer specific 2-hydroxyacid dehydrogenase catalytic domain-containing protein n=1 Tax=Aquilegia coerulea TaxID=218851 RepID=A0A2G5EMX3_AQUCA|nr:hypothetical protein AQUCO_00600080v1 [Aquilegia coerulea]